MEYGLTAEDGNLWPTGQKTAVHAMHWLKLDDIASRRTFAGCDWHLERSGRLLAPERSVRGVTHTTYEQCQVSPEFVTINSPWNCLDDRQF